MRPYIKANLIPLPTWAREPVIEFYEDEEEAKKAVPAFQPHMSAILTKIHEEIEAFFNNPDCTYDEGFPKWARLTGEYYWSGTGYIEFLEGVNPRPHYRLSWLVACLEKQWLESQKDFDYLGLDATVMLWWDTGEWEFLGFDTSSI